MYFPYSFWAGSNFLRDMIAFWTFNNGSDIGNDDYNGFDLTLNGSITNPAGKFGKAIYNAADGSAYVDVADPNKKFNLSTDKTFCFWFKGDDAESGGAYFIGKYYNSPGTNYLAAYSASHLDFLIDTSVSTYTAVSQSVISNSVWYMATLRHYLLQKKISVQVNDNMPIEETYTGNPQTYDQNFNALEVGAVGSAIDHLGVWNRVLSLTESNTLYNNGKGLEIFR